MHETANMNVNESNMNASESWRPSLPEGLELEMRLNTFSSLRRGPPRPEGPEGLEVKIA